MCLGGALRGLSHHEEAIASFDKAYELGELGFWVWGGRILPLIRLGRYQEAATSAYKCILSITMDRGVREWFERRVAISLRKVGLHWLVPIWARFLQLIGFRATY
jgi:hypothetical protein